MSVAVHRRRGETFDALFRRFGKKVKMSGRIIQAKKIRFHVRPPSASRRRESALYRARRQRYFAYLEKVGKLEEELAKLQAKKKFRRR